MNIMLPSVRRRLENLNIEIVNKKNILDTQCDLMNEVLKKSVKKNVCLNLTGNKSPNEPATSRLYPGEKSVNCTPGCSHIFKVKSNDSVYCFENLEDLMSRITIPVERDFSVMEEKIDDESIPKPKLINEDRYPKEVAEGLKTVHEFMDTTSRDISQSLKGEKNFMEKLDEMIKKDNDMFSLVNDKVIETLGDAVSESNECYKNEKILINGDFEGELNKFDEYIQEFQQYLLHDLLIDLKSLECSEKVYPELYKTSVALRNICNLKRPILIKK